MPARLIDHVGYFDQMIAAAKKQAGMETVADAKFLTPLVGYADTRRRDIAPADADDGLLAQLARAAEDDAADAAPDASAADTLAPARTKIAVITASGQIVDDRANPGMAGTMLTPDAMRKAFAAARQDGGGRRLASRHAGRVRLCVGKHPSPGAARAQMNGTPVVVSMGAVAASGGYWIASAADHIVANPATLTGSIGVFGGKIVVGAALQNWGINVETLKTSPSADIWSALRLQPRRALGRRRPDAADLRRLHRPRGRRPQAAARYRRKTGEGRPDLQRSAGETKRAGRPVWAVSMRRLRWRSVWLACRPMCGRPWSTTRPRADRLSRSSPF